MLSKRPLLLTPGREEAEQATASRAGPRQRICVQGRCKEGLGCRALEKEKLGDSSGLQCHSCPHPEPSEVRPLGP